MSTPEELTPTSQLEADLVKAGFTHQFALMDDALVDLDRDVSYPPQDVTIVQQHRVEGNSDPADESMLFALQTPDGQKGTLTVTYGPAASHLESLRLLGTGRESITNV